MPPTGDGQHEVQIEVGGHTYVGRYTLSGSGTRSIELWFRGRRATDTFPSEADQPGYADVLARDLLHRLVREADDADPPQESG